MKSCKPHEKNETKNIKILNLLVKNWRLSVWCSLFHFFMWIMRFQILICFWWKFLVDFTQKDKNPLWLNLWFISFIFRNKSSHTFYIFVLHPHSRGTFEFIYMLLLCAYIMKILMNEFIQGSKYRIFDFRLDLT